MSIKNREVKKDILRLAGTIPDTTLAKKLGCGKQLVWRTRRDAGIACFSGPRSTSLTATADWDKLGLGKTPDVRIAEALGCSRERIRQIRKAFDIPKPPRVSKLMASRDWSKVPLGKETDAKIARDLGIPTYKVSLARTSLNIPKLKNYHLDTPISRGLAMYAGTMPDVQVASIVGCTLNHVCRYRKAHSVKSWLSTQKKDID